MLSAKMEAIPDCSSISAGQLGATANCPTPRRRQARPRLFKGTERSEVKSDIDTAGEGGQRREGSRFNLPERRPSLLRSLSLFLKGLGCER